MKVELSEIKSGDRVLSRYAEGYGVVTRYDKATEPGTEDALMVQWESGMRSGISAKSVLRVFLAPPGVPMIAMTPERIRMLERYRADHKYDVTQDMWCVDEMIAEARGDV